MTDFEKLIDKAKSLYPHRHATTLAEISGVSRQHIHGMIRRGKLTHNAAEHICSHGDFKEFDKKNVS